MLRKQVMRALLWRRIGFEICMAVAAEFNAPDSA